MPLINILEETTDFEQRLRKIKDDDQVINWYPYNSMHNFQIMGKNFRGAGQEAFDAIGDGTRLADIGAADGDTAFFFETKGAQVTIIDNRSTNYNDCDGIRRMKAHLNSGVRLREIDLDFVNHIPGQYDFAIFLGILYHLRNPMQVLTALAECAPRMVVSTGIFSRLTTGEDVQDHELSALIPTRAVNDDPTNYWVHTPANLRTLLKRSGWQVIDEFRTGDIGKATPMGAIEEGRVMDERMFCYCERNSNWADIRLHHDF